MAIFFGAAIIVVVVIEMRNLNPAEYILHAVYFVRDTMTLRLETPEESSLYKLTVK